jgi:hypothetical protein
VVILQRLRGRGFDGGITILKDYLHKVRTESVARRAYVRVESQPGDRFEIDWGHFDAARLVFSVAVPSPAAALPKSNVAQCLNRRIAQDFSCNGNVLLLHYGPLTLRRTSLAIAGLATHSAEGTGGRFPCCVLA